MRPACSHFLTHALLVTAVSIVAWGCSSAAEGSDAQQTSTSLAQVIDEQPLDSTSSTAATVAIEVDASSFPALGDMTPVRGFFVDNLVGDLDATVAIASSTNGGTYPVGSLVQLIPGEAMVKREQGFSKATNDWEFFELDVVAAGPTIRVRGGSEVVNRFGLSCADCHLQADPQFDLVCEDDHGCDPLPFDRATIEAIQKSDPRPLERD